MALLTAFADVTQPPLFQTSLLAVNSSGFSKNVHRLRSPEDETKEVEPTTLNGPERVYGISQNPYTMAVSSSSCCSSCTPLVHLSTPSY